MEEKNSQFQQKLNDWLVKAGDVILSVSQRLLVLLQKFWAWYKSINWPHIPLTAFQWVLLFYVIFGLSFMVATPILEASDELWHFGMVEYLRENNGALPVHDVSDPEKIYENNRNTIYRQEGSQPPLYYYTMALLTAPIDISDAESYREPNPHVRAGEPDSWGNKNLVLHPVDGVPLTGTPLAIYFMRLLGLAMGAVTIWAVFKSGELIAPHRPVVGLLAAVITAFNPMFLFISASVNNDTMIIMLNSVVILLALQTLREGFDLRRSVLLAILLGLATLTKLSALVLVPIIAIAALWVARRDKDWTGLLVLGGAMFIAWASMSGWWYWRNIQLYGELFGTQTMAAVAGIRTDPFTIGSLLAEFEGFRQGYWGVFGAFNIVTNPLMYALADFVVFIGIFGVMFLVAQLVSIQDFSFARRELSLVLFLLSIVLVGIVAYINWTSMTYASQGRLLFPYFAAISPLLAVGLVEILWWILFLLTPPDRSYVRAGDAVPEPILRESLRYPIIFVTAFFMLFSLFSIFPNYRAPRPLDELPEDVEQIYARYDNIELIGYERRNSRYFPGEDVRFTLYWRVIEPTEDDLSLAIALIDPFQEVVSERTVSTYPGAGTLRTSTWEAGKIYADTYEIGLSRNINSRYPFNLAVNWYNEDPANRIVSLNDAENPITVELAIGAVVKPNLRPSLAGLELINDNMVAFRTFGSLIVMEGYAYNVLEDGLSFDVEVLWSARNNIETAYTTFMHIYDEDGNLVTQSDYSLQHATNTIYPNVLLPTNYWRFDENFRLAYEVREPETGFAPGVYSVQVGWYEYDEEAQTFTNLFVPVEVPEDELDAVEIESTTYELFTFEVDADGTILLPALNIDTQLDELQGAPAPPVRLEVTPEIEITAEAESTDAVESTAEATESSE